MSQIQKQNAAAPEAPIFLPPCGDLSRPAEATATPALVITGRPLSLWFPTLPAPPIHVASASWCRVYVNGITVRVRSCAWLLPVACVRAQLLAVSV